MTFGVCPTAGSAVMNWSTPFFFLLFPHAWNSSCVVMPPCAALLRLIKHRFRWPIFCFVFGKTLTLPIGEFCTQTGHYSDYFPRVIFLHTHTYTRIKMAFFLGWGFFSGALNNMIFDERLLLLNDDDDLLAHSLHPSPSNRRAKRKWKWCPTWVSVMPRGEEEEVEEETNGFGIKQRL